MTATKTSWKGGDPVNPISEVIQNMATPTRNIGDYTDDEGFLCCGTCRERKEMDITVPESLRPSGVMRVRQNCRCERERYEAQEKARREQDFQIRMERLRRDGITDPAYLKYTFDQDDRRNPEVSDVCLKYVQNWDSMKADNIGILFYGDVGTGKSFLACCIANALLGRLVSVSVTNFPRILNTLQGTFDDERQKRIDRLQQYSLLVIDDLGVERDTAFSVEQVYNVIDTRARSGKPLIVTTNLSMKDLQNPPTLAHKRIYDRVLEMCPIRLKLTGESRRVSNANDRKEKARRLLGLEGA